MATYTITNTFTADTTAVASEVNQNFTDVLTALNAFDAGNLASGTVPLARISGLTVSQLAAATIVLEAEGIGNNDNDTTWPTSAAVKDFVDTRSGWTPSIFTGYAGEESITFPNGLILKMGLSAHVTGAATVEITYGTAFPNDIISMSATFNSSQITSNESVLAKQKTGSLLSVLQLTNSGTVGDTAWWQVWGY